MKKRILLLLFLGALFLSLSVGAQAEKITLVHWQHHSPARLEMVKQFAGEFMQEHPGVEIKIESIPFGDYFKKLLPALAAGSGPDTFQIPAGETPAYVSAGILAPLKTGVISTEQIETDFIASALAHLKFEGKYYGLPTDVQSIVLFYNPKLFAEAGLDPDSPPETWAELIEYAKAIHKRDDDGATTQMGVATGGYGPVLFSLMIQNGAEIYNEESKFPAFNNKKALKAFKFATDLVTEAKVEDLQFGSRWNAFRQGKLGMVYAHPAMIGSFRATVPDLVFKVAEIPAPVKGGSRASLITNWAYVQSGKIKDPKATLATEWIYLLTNAKSQKLWTLKTGELPSRKAVVEDPDFQKDPLLSPVMESMKKGVPMPWQSRMIENSIRKGYLLVVLKGESPEEALKFALEDAVKEEKDQLAKSIY